MAIEKYWAKAGLSRNWVEIEASAELLSMLAYDSLDNGVGGGGEDGASVPLLPLDDIACKRTNFSNKAAITGGGLSCSNFFKASFSLTSPLRDLVSLTAKSMRSRLLPSWVVSLS